MFREKYADGDHLSMTRVVAFLFAVVFLASLGAYAYRGKDIGWPFVTLGVVTLLAVPIQAIFAFLQQWVSSREGRDLLTTLTHKVEDSLLSGGKP